MPTGKTTEELFSRHAKDAKRRNEGDKKIKHKHITDDMNCVSYIHSYVSRALQVRMPTKPEKTVVPAPPQPPTETVTDFAPPMTLPQTSIVIAEPPIRPKRKAATKATTTLQPSQKRKRSSPSITESDLSIASTQNYPQTYWQAQPFADRKDSDVKTTTNSKQIFCCHNHKYCRSQSRHRTIKLYRRPVFTHSDVLDTKLRFP